VSYVVGGSAIYAASRDFNFLLETLHEWNETVDMLSSSQRERAFTISPGIRKAFNFPAGQLVVGIGTPIRFATASSPSYGIFLYLLLEHSFLKP
jgi:hypothetical protein